MGFEGTVTSGTMSGPDRQIPGSAAQSRALVDLIQVDAPPPRATPAALLDAHGRVIGINEASPPPPPSTSPTTYSPTAPPRTPTWTCGSTR